MLNMAAQIIAQKETTFAPDAYEDRYEEALMDLVKAEDHRWPADRHQGARTGQWLVNLMDALRRAASRKNAGRPPPAWPRRPPAAGAGKAAATKKPAVKAVASGAGLEEEEVRLTPCR